MNTAQILAQAEAECGELRSYARLGLVRTTPASKVRSAAAYVGVCRRLAEALLATGDRHAWAIGRAARYISMKDGYYYSVDAHPLSGDQRVDGRLVACGWNRMSPTDWLDHGLQDFLDYWQKVADRPQTVGSEYNPSPEWAAECWWRGYPQRLAHSEMEWALRSRAGGYQCRRLPRRRLRLALRAVRALRRTSYRRDQLQRGKLGVKVLAVLGRLAAETQTVLLAGRTGTHLRDLGWELLARWRTFDVSWTDLEAVASLDRRLVWGWLKTCPLTPLLALENPERYATLLRWGMSPKEEE